VQIAREIYRGEWKTLMKLSLSLTAVYGSSTSVPLEKGLKVLVGVPRREMDSALSGIALSEPSLADDWLNPEEEEAWAHLQ